MFEHEQITNCGLMLDESLKEMRIRRFPIQLDEGIIMVDQLESSGTIRIFESLSGAVDDIPKDISSVEYGLNAVQVGEIMVSIIEIERKVQLDRLYCEYGYEDELIPILMEQLLNFARFYNFKLSLPIRKKHRQQGQTACERGKAVAKTIFGM